MIRLKGFGQFLDLDTEDMINELVLVDHSGRELRLQIEQEALEKVAIFVDSETATEPASSAPEKAKPTKKELKQELQQVIENFSGLEIQDEEYDQEDYSDRFRGDDDLAALMDAAHGDLGEA